MGAGQDSGRGASGASAFAGAFAGVDVSKDKLDVFVDATGEAFTVPNTAEGVAQLVARLRPVAGLELVVVENTGGYERRCAADLLEAGLPVALVNPRRTRDFARAAGRLAKNDRIDAESHARFGRAVRPRRAERVPPERAELDELVGRRRQLVQMRAAERVRLQQVVGKAVRSSVEKALRHLDAQVHELEKRIAKLVEDDEDWRGRAALLRSVPGVGPAVAATLVAEMPELGSVSRQRIAALAGVAPTTTTPAGGAAAASAPAGGRRCGARCTWPPWPPGGSTP